MSIQSLILQPTNFITCYQWNCGCAYDDAAWEVSVDVADAWAAHILNQEIYQEIGNFLLTHHQARDVIEFTVLQTGTFNTVLQMNFE